MLRRPETLWLILVFASLPLAVWWIPGGSSVNSDSYSVAYPGKKAFYQTLRRLEPNVSRSIDQLIPNPMSFERILILGPARQPTDEEWESIYDAVQNGASVVYAASLRDPTINASQFGVRVESVSPFEMGDSAQPSDSTPSGTAPAGEEGEDVPADDTDDAQPVGEETDVATVESDSEADEEAEQEAAPVEVNNFAELLTGEQPAESELVEGTVSWRSNSHLELESGDWDVLVTVNGKPQVAQRQFGLGYITLVASDDIFSNGAMLHPERAILAYRIIESAPNSGGRTWFDETLNASGVPKVFGILFDPLFRPVTLQLLLIAVLFGWLGARRFGPIKRTTHGRRRSIVEHAEAVGILYMRADAGTHAVKCQHEYLKQELRRIYGSGFRVDDPVVVAQVAQEKEIDVRALFERTDEAIHLKRPVASVADTLKRLTKLLADIKAK